MILQQDFAIARLIYTKKLMKIYYPQISKYFSFSAKYNDDDIELDVTKDGEKLSVHHPQFLTIFRMLSQPPPEGGIFPSVL